MIGTYDISKTEAAARARDIMQKKIDTGRASAANLLEHVNTHVPVDAVVRASALDFRLGGSDLAPHSVLEVGFGNETRTIHKHALGQMAEKSGPVGARIPGAYLSELANGAEWQRDFAVKALNTHFHRAAPSSRFLVRSTDNQVRGFLSDRYRRLDSRPLLEAFATACQSIGAVPVDGVVSETRVALKAMLPMVFEPVPNEVMCLGIEWGNSDYGAAKHTVRAFILRLWCLNGATMEDSLGQVHLGGKLSDNIELSQRTYDLDTRTSVSALKDIVQGLLGPARVSALLGGIATANEKQIDWKNLRTPLARSLLKGELNAVEAAYNSEDVINLPAGKSIWRASNAVSWIAGKTEDHNRRLELERIAGEIINGKRDSEKEAA